MKNVFLKNGLKVSVLFLVIVFFVTANSDYKEINQSFLGTLAQAEPIARDSLVDLLAGKKIQGRAVIASVSTADRYQKKYRITAAFSDKKYPVIIRFFLYSDDELYALAANTGKTLIYEGRVILTAPLNNKRTEYLCEVILESGTIVIE